MRYLFVFFLICIGLPAFAQPPGCPGTWGGTAICEHHPSAFSQVCTCSGGFRLVDSSTSCIYGSQAIPGSFAKCWCPQGGACPPPPPPDCPPHLSKDGDGNCVCPNPGTQANDGNACVSTCEFGFDAQGMCYPEECPYGENTTGEPGACDTRECPIDGYESVQWLPGTWGCFPVIPDPDGEGSSSSSASQGGGDGGEGGEGGSGSSQGGGFSSAPECGPGTVHSPYNPSYCIPIVDEPSWCFEGYTPHYTPQGWVCAAIDTAEPYGCGPGYIPGFDPQSSQTVCTPPFSSSSASSMPSSAQSSSASNESAGSSSSSASCPSGQELQGYVNGNPVCTVNCPSGQSWGSVNGTWGCYGQSSDSGDNGNGGGGGGSGSSTGSASSECPEGQTCTSTITSGTCNPDDQSAPECGGEYDAIACAVAIHTWKIECEDKLWRENLLGTEEFNTHDTLLNPDDPKNTVRTHDVDVSAFTDFDTGRFGGSSGACPQDRVVSVLGGSITFTFSWICRFAELIRNIVLAMAYFIAALIYIRGLMGMTE